MIRVDMYTGSSHFHRGIKSEFIDVMGPIFCNTIRKVKIGNDSFR